MVDVFAASALIATVLAGAPPAKPHASIVTHDQCLLTAAEPSNPWALAHGITAFGPLYLAADGRKASDVMVHDFLERSLSPDGGAGRPSYAFARYAKDGTPVEPHPNTIAKTLALAGLPMSTRFETRFGKPVTLGELVDSAKASYRHTPKDEASWRDGAWTIDLIAATSKPGATLTLSDGSSLSVDRVMDDALDALERADAELAEGLKKGLPQVDKRKQGIYGHPCGGLHFVQAVFSWARFPEVRKRWGKRLDAQVDVLFYRLDSERRQYEAVLQQAPQYRLQILIQMLKFYGHFLETTARMKKDLAWKPTEVQAQAVMRAKALLDAAVRDLDADKAWERMPTLKTQQPQLYLDLIGDSCHAAHGMDGWP